MNGFLETAPLEKLRKVYGPLLVVFVLGVCLRAWYPHTWQSKDLADVMGDAFIVASVIGFCIDLWATSLLINHAAEELSLRLVGYGLPPAARTLIHKLVHETKMVYRNYHVTYSLQRHPELDRHVIVYLTSSWTLVNNGGSPEEYSTEMCQELSYDPQPVHLQCGGKSFGPMDIIKRVTAGGVVALTAPDSCPKFTIKPSSATTPVDDLSPDQQCHVFWQITFSMPEYYSDVVAFRGIVISPTIEFLGSSEEWEFRSDEESPEKGRPNTADQRAWRYDRAFIDGQHVRVRWKPKTPVSATDPPASA